MPALQIADTSVRYLPESFNLLLDIVSIVCFVTRSKLCQEDLANHLFRLTALGVHWLYDFSFHPRLSTLQSGVPWAATSHTNHGSHCSPNCCEDKASTMLLGWSQNIVHATNHSSVTRYQSRTLHGVWTLILLMFVMAVETSVSLVFL